MKDPPAGAYTSWKGRDGDSMQHRPRGWSFQKTNMRMRTAARSCAIRHTVVVHDSPLAVSAPTNSAKVTKNPPIPTRTKAVNVIAATAGAVPTTATMDRLMRPVRRATRPKTRRPRCCEGDLPISQIFSPNPGIVVPPGLTARRRWSSSPPRSAGPPGRRESRGAGYLRPIVPRDSLRQEGENHEEQSDEDIQLLEEHGRADQTDDEQEHSDVGDRRTPDEAQILPRNRGLLSLSGIRPGVTLIHKDRSRQEEDQSDNDCQAHEPASIHHHRPTHHRGWWLQSNPCL